MADETKKVEVEVGAEDAQQNTRRTFIKTAAQVAVTAPAVGLLLSASVKPALAQLTAYEASQNHILDDFTFGNNDEDVDAINLGSNTNITGAANQDDHVP